MGSPPILPSSATVTDYKLPTFSQPIVRRPYGSLDDEFKQKLDAAFAKVKDKPIVLRSEDALFDGLLQETLLSPGDHIGFLFFIFHRLYFFIFEKMLQAAAHNESVGVPYSDSTFHSYLPYPVDWVHISEDFIGTPVLSAGPFSGFSSDVDRRWTIWRTLGGKRMDITHPELLQKRFLFYDENMNLVRAKVEDFLDNQKLGYTYQDMPKPRSKKFEPSTRKNLSNIDSSLPAATAVFPATLDKAVTFYVTRPETSSSWTEDKEEFLNFYVEYDETKNIWFDAYLTENDDANLLDVEMAEYTGSFINFAWPDKGRSDEQTKMTTTWSLEIAQVLEDLLLTGKDKIPVTLVPKCNGDVVIVKSVDITG